MSPVQASYDRKFKFCSSFDPSTGFYYRSCVLDEHGRPTKREPFMASFPHILDVGIMGHCRHGLSGLCPRARVQCYQEGPTRWQQNMSLEDFSRILRECRGRAYQFALGGRGDPDQHEHFERILESCRGDGIVPNFTSSGFGLTASAARLSAQYCGAVAISWYGAAYTRRAIDMLLEAGVKTNVHFVLGNDTIEEAMRLIEQDGFPRGINKVVFLLHKPVGLGRRANVLSPFDGRVKRFFSLFNDSRLCNMAGFDSCSVPALVNFAPAIHPATFDACEGGRFSAYVSPDMKMLPCSFDQDYRWAVDLRSSTMVQAWRSPRFGEFRGRLAARCHQCESREQCLGGCPIAGEIVLCERFQVSTLKHQSRAAWAAERQGVTT